MDAKNSTSPKAGPDLEGVLAMIHRLTIKMCLYLAVGLWATQVWTQPLLGPPGLDKADDLQLVDTHVLELDGQILDDADIYFSPLEVFYLAVSKELEAPLMISPRGRLVQWVDGKKLKKRGPVNATLGSRAAGRSVGKYNLHHKVYSFDLEGAQAKLVPAPLLLGRQSIESMKGHHKLYAHRSQAHVIKRTGLKILPVRDGEVLVQVFFNSQDSMCKRILPKILKLEETFRGPKKNLRFEYFGLPARFPEDEKARELGVWGVPIAIVYVDGKEVGRVRALELDRPEENLLPLLTGRI